jgi:hypothetical protein
MELRDKIEAPKRDVGGQQGSEVGIIGKEFVRRDIEPVAGSGMAGRHAELLQGLNGSLKRGGVVAIGSSDVVGAENWHKEMKFALVGKRMQGSTDGDGVNGGAGKRGRKQERDRLRKRGGKDSLRVEKS